MDKLDYTYHNHTKRCGHASGEDEEFVLAAIEMGFRTLCFSDHIILPDRVQPRMRGSASVLRDYFDSIEYLKNKYKDIIEIHLGFEAEWFLTDNSYLESHCGKLMTLRGVELSAADGKATFAPDDGSVTLTANCANRNFKGISSSALVLRTSTFADFAGNVMPTGKVDVTGIFTRFRNTWQILMRSTADIQPAQ